MAPIADCRHRTCRTRKGSQRAAPHFWSECQAKFSRNKAKLPFWRRAGSVITSPAVSAGAAFGWSRRLEIWRPGRS